MTPAGRAATSLAAWAMSGAAIDATLARGGYPWSTWIRDEWPTPAKVGLASGGLYLIAHVCCRIRHDPLSYLGGRLDGRPLV